MQRLLLPLMGALVASSAAIGCDGGVATQTLVFVAVDPALGGATLRVRVFDQEGGMVYDRTLPGDGAAITTVLPARVPLDPLGGDASRRFRVEAELRDADGAVVASQRAESGYVVDERREIWLCIDARCGTAACGAEERCAAGGSCGPIAMATDPAGTSTVASACGFAVPTDAGTDATGDATPDASPDADGGPPCDCPCASDRCVDSVCSPVSAVEDVSAGDGHVCAVDSDGRLFCWGENSDGQLADTDRSARPAPTVAVALGPARQVSAGRRHTCALLVDGTLHCWGDGDLGQIGMDRESSDVPVAQVPPNTTTHPENGWSQVSAGGTVTCAVHGASLFCWGSNREGQLGIGAPPGALDSTPNLVSGTWRRVAAGDRHVCALRDDVDGTLACWGTRDSGRLGLLSDSDVPMPTDPVTSPANVRASRTRSYVSMDLGIEHTCAIMTTRDLRCWGTGAQLGLGITGRTTNSAPVAPEDPTPTPTWDRVAAAAAHTCALDDAGGLWCWGQNRVGELGLGAGAGQQTRPVRVGSLSWTDVTAGQDITCAVAPDGRLYCWGSNDAGQLGIGDFEATDVATAPVCLPAL